MRWWLAALVVLVGVSGVLAWWRVPEETVGARMLASAERELGGLRGAIAVVDYVPGEGDAVLPAGWEEGEGGLPGMTVGGVGVAEAGHWMRGPGVLGTWGRAGEEPLKEALRHEELVWPALRGFSLVGGDAIVQGIKKELRGLADEELMQAWLQADRAKVAEKGTPEAAAREVWLLGLRAVEGPVVVLARPEGRAYLLAAEGLVQVLGYERGGRLAWTGMLRCDKDVAAARVRATAAAMARRAYGLLAKGGTQAGEQGR